VQISISQTLNLGCFGVLSAVSYLGPPMIAFLQELLVYLLRSGALRFGCIRLQSPIV